MKTVLIDARMYGLTHAGIGRYIMNLVANLPFVSEGKVKYKLVVKKDQLKAIKNELGNRFEYIPASSSHYSIAEQFEIPAIIQKTKPDLIHFPHFNAPVFCQKKYLLTVHDLIKHYFRGKETTTKLSFLYWPKYLGYRLLSWLVIKRAKAIIVPSQWWKKKLADKFSVSKNKITVTWEGVGETFLKQKAASQQKTLKKYGLKKDSFFVYTGSVYPHKNVERLVRAMTRIKNENISLAIICSRNTFSKRLEKTVKKLNAESRINFLGFVPDKEMKPIYSASLALVQPSLMEGFGLTGLEAMASGCPVASSNTSCLPEIYGNAAVYFDPKSDEQLLETLNSLIGNEKLRDSLIAKGAKRLALFSWKNTAKETVKVYQKLLNES